jgi:Bacterial virulence protein (VirJ)
MRLIASGTWAEEPEGLSDRNRPGRVASTDVRVDKRSSFLKPKQLFPLLLAFVSGFVAPQAGFAESLTNIGLRGTNQQLHLYGSRGGVPVILSSGDLGWAGLVSHVAEFLSSQGYFIVGFNSRAYLESFTSKTSTLKPQDVPQDYKALVDFAVQRGASRPIMAGVSEGAGLSVLAAADPQVRSSVRGVLGLGLPDQNELGWKWQDFTIWITKKTPNEPSFMVEDIISKMSPLPLAEIHSTHDEFLPLEQAKAMFGRAGEPKRMWVIEAANHRFSNNRVEFDRALLEALEWIKNPR